MQSVVILTFNICYASIITHMFTNITIPMGIHIISLHYCSVQYKSMHLCMIYLGVTTACKHLYTLHVFNYCLMLQTLYIYRKGKETQLWDKRGYAYMHVVYKLCVLVYTLSCCCSFIMKETLCQSTQGVQCRIFLYVWWLLHTI